MIDKSFREYFNESLQAENDKINEAKRIIRESGAHVITENAFTKFIIGTALSLGLITNAAANEYNNTVNDHHKISTSMLAKDMQKAYNVQDNIELTNKIVLNIADTVIKNIIAEMDSTNKTDANDLVKTEEWQNAVAFYKKLSAQDKGLANMFSRKLDRELTKTLQIAPNIQNFVNYEN